MIKVKATREGLYGQHTADGFVIDKITPFVALPSTHALRKIIRIRNPLNDHVCLATVHDVGPWNIHDEQYVFGGNRPQAESGTDLFGRKTNGAGIDLGDAVWDLLGMKDNGDVEWEFS